MVKTKKNVFVVTFKQKGKKGLFVGSKTFKTRDSARKNIARVKRLIRQANSDLPLKARRANDNLFFGHKVRKRSDIT